MYRTTTPRRIEPTGGGTAGNQEITARTGVILIVLLAVLGVTILRISQLIWLHLFLGLLLLGPVALKMASTGYRFARYYLHDPLYRHHGPPEFALRLLAPAVVVSTVVVFASGLILMFQGPAARGSWLLIHKASFIVWLAVTALHVLGHLPRLPRQLRAVGATDDLDAQSLGGRARGSAGRWILLVGSVLAGVVLALILIPDFAAWTAQGAFHHRHD